MIKQFLLTTFFCCTALSTFAACKGLETNLQDNDVDYRQTARQNFEAGEAAFEDGDYEDAALFFGYVKNKFPYSKYSALAELRMADANFEQEKWLEAADAYRLFIRFHPRHEKVSYASFRIALAFWRETSGAPNDTFPIMDTIEETFSPFPPSHERDLSATRDAIASFNEFILRHPEDENIEEAKRLRREARTVLAEHEMSVALFYIQRNRWQGALWRYETVANAYEDTPQAPEAMMRGAEIAAEELSDPDTAKRLYARLIKVHPESSQAADAKTFLKELESNTPPEQPAPKETTAN